MVSATKDPVKVASGLAGARARWGPEPRVVRLDDLSTPQRRLVVALIEAERAKNKEAVPDVEPGTAEPEGQRHDRPAA